MTEEEERSRISRLEWRVDTLDRDRAREAAEWREVHARDEARIKALENLGFYAMIGVGVAFVIGWITVNLLNIGELVRSWAGK